MTQARTIICRPKIQFTCALADKDKGNLVNDNENVFEESEFVRVAPTDDDFDLGAEGHSGPTYQLRFCKADVKVLVDTKIIAEVDYSDLRPGFDRSDYKAVIDMMKDVKEMSLEQWLQKYKVVT